MVLFFSLNEFGKWNVYRTNCLTRPTHRSHLPKRVDSTSRPLSRPCQHQRRPLQQRIAQQKQHQSMYMSQQRMAEDGSISTSTPPPTASYCDGCLRFCRIMSNHTEAQSLSVMPLCRPPRAPDTLVLLLRCWCDLRPQSI